MKETGVSTPDELVQIALQTLCQVRANDVEGLGPDTKAAIQDGLAQADRSETRSREDVREELRTRFITKDEAASTGGAGSAARSL